MQNAAAQLSFILMRLLAWNHCIDQSSSIGLSMPILELEAILLAYDFKIS
jgi:hypothetical protein